MPSLTIALSSDQEALMKRLIESGAYDSPEDLLTAAFSRLEAFESDIEARRTELEAKIEEGLDDVRAGRVYDAADVFKELDIIIATGRKRQDAAE